MALFGCWPPEKVCIKIYMFKNDDKANTIQNSRACEGKGWIRRTVYVSATAAAYEFLLIHLEFKRIKLSMVMVQLYICLELASRLTRSVSQLFRSFMMIC